MTETLDGIIVADKPEGWTSHDVVNRIRRLANTRRVGHLGTLDPMATGVLPVVVGRATRLAQFYTRSDKVYDARVYFGYATDTYDRDGTAITKPVELVLRQETLEHCLGPYRGEFLMTPPPVSAKKIGGVPAYRLARQQPGLTLRPVPVQVYDLSLLGIEGQEARLRTHCSAGTYMRSIAHELGRAMGSGAHLSALRRLQSGEFTIDEAHTIPELEMLARDERLHEVVIPASALLPSFPAVVIDAVTAGLIRHGRDFPVSPFRVDRGARYVKAVSAEGELVAIGEAKLPNLYHPVVVL